MDSALPSGNAVAALVLLRLFSLTGRQLYYDERAKETLRVFHDTTGRNAYGAAALLGVLDWCLSGWGAPCQGMGAALAAGKVAAGGRRARTFAIGRPARRR